MADEKDVVCQVCGDSLADGRPVVRCTQCQTAHHKECFDYMGRCSTFGCPGTKCRTVDPAKVVAPSASSEVVLHIDAPPAARPQQPPAPVRRSAPPVPLRPLNPGNRQWSRMARCRSFPILRPFWVLRDVLAVTILFFPLPALVGSVGVAPLVAMVLVIFWLSVWPRLRSGVYLIDRKSRTLQRYAKPTRERVAICGFDDVVSVTCRSGGLICQDAVILTLCDGSELVLGGFPDLTRALEAADALSRILTARMLVEY